MTNVDNQTKSVLPKEWEEAFRIARTFSEFRDCKKESLSDKELEEAINLFEVISGFAVGMRESALSFYAGNTLATLKGYQRARKTGW